MKFPLDFQSPIQGFWTPAITTLRMLSQPASKKRQGTEERLACLSWAYEDWRTKEGVKKVLTQLAQERAARAAQTSAVESDEGTTKPAPDPSPAAGNKAQVGTAEPSAPEDRAVIPSLSPELAAQYAAIDARAERRRLRWLELEAKRAQERERTELANFMLKRFVQLFAISVFRRRLGRDAV